MVIYGYLWLFMVNDFSRWSMISPSHHQPISLAIIMDEALMIYDLWILNDIYESR